MIALGRMLPMLLLWLLAAWPLLLVGIDAFSPPMALRTQLAAIEVLRVVALYGGGLLLVVCILVPPVPAGIRLWLHRLGERVRVDRGPLQRAIADLANFETPVRRVEAGRAALAAKDAAAAIPHLQRAVELDPTPAAPWHLLGIAHLGENDPQRAIASLREAIQRDPGHAFGDTLLQLARAHMRIGDLPRAAELLQQHATVHGGGRRSHYWLGQCLRALGRRGEAMAAFRIAAAPPPARPRLAAEENYYRALARMAVLFHRGSDAAPSP